MRHRATLRLLTPMMLVLPLAHCSCQKQAGTGAVAEIPADAALAAGNAAPTAGTPATETTGAGASAIAAQQAASALHAYLGALPGAERNRADAYWAGANPGTPAGDALLRDLADLRGMRIQNDVPVALDGESPPRAFEIPVHLRLDTGAGGARVQGWYRLRARVDGQGWEITSASLQPALD